MSNLIKSLRHSDESAVKYLQDIKSYVYYQLSLSKEFDYNRDYWYVWDVPVYIDCVCEDDEQLRAWVELESFEDEEVKPTPANKVSIEALARSIIKNYECANCAVCLEELIKLYTELDYARNHRYLWSIPSFTDRVCDNDDDEVLRAWVERESFEEAEVKHTPASKVSIEALARSIIKNNDCTTCAICLEQLYGNKKEGALKVTMPCKHEFHEDCIVEWLHTNHLCPLCRFELPTQIADY
ncbi:RING-H2 finger protein ATL22-like [Chenopodium quinoa]|uniref:RING-H2 finger protein ATL22-like n=1 Tax=Chenopodium quinoa TaxID=63459 RepID=UPI000B78F75F|nr:RING-H2 finger protein ATL22-like [Chenopodium quinoa]